MGSRIAEHQILISRFGLGALIWVLTVSGAYSQSQCELDALDIQSPNSSTVRFTIEVVDTPETRALGLMNRAELGRFSGMLFVYPEAQRVSFWMRNTLIPLDMIFVDARGVIQNIHENATPLSEVSILGGNNIKYVFEVNGGASRNLGVQVGAVLRHPSISGPEVIWPCE